MLNGRPCIVSLISSRNAAHPLSVRLPELGEVLYRDQLSDEAAAKIGPDVDVLVGASDLKVPKEWLNNNLKFSMCDNALDDRLWTFVCERNYVINGFVNPPADIIK